MLQVHALTCRRGGRAIFQAINFTLQPGQALLVTGPNASGKSSLLRILAGLLPAASGDLLWQGVPIAKDAANHRARLHYLGHLDALKSNLTPIEILDLWRALRGLKVTGNGDPLAAFALAHVANRPIRHLSAGQKRRLALSRLLLDEAPLWLLDEPVTALDKIGQELLADMIAAHRTRGGILVAATHQPLALIEAHDLVLGVA